MEGLDWTEWNERRRRNLKLRRKVVPCANEYDSQHEENDYDR